MAAGHYKFRCQPAFTVIAALGGVRAVAGLLGVSAEAVSQWNRPARKGGDGGYIPKKHWPALLKHAAEIDAKNVTAKLLRTGKLEKLGMGAASKRKGDAFEFQVVRELVAAGFDRAHRVPLSGAVKGYPGDVLAKGTPTGDWIIQCKINKKETGGGRGGVARFLAEVGVGKVTTKSGAVFMALRGHTFVELMHGCRPDVVNMPEILTSGSSIEDHIDGHDALLFRRDGVKTWNAIVRLERYEAVK